MSQSLIDGFVERLAREPAVLVSVDSTQGSVPREAGAWMGVFADGAVVGTVGGGHLEFEAILIARRALCGETIEARVALPSDPRSVNAAAAWCTCASTSCSRPTQRPCNSA